MHRVLIALSTFAEHGNQPLKLLEKNGFALIRNATGKRLQAEEIVQLGQHCDGIIAGLEPYTDDVLDRLPKLRCISRCGVGIDNISLKKAEKRGIKILNTPNVVVQPVAELTVGFILDLLRRVTWHTIGMKAKRWERQTGDLLQGRKVGILGLGRIGRRVAEILKRLEADVYGFDLKPDQAWAGQHGIKLLSQKDLLRTADILCLHLGGSEGGPFVLGAEQLALLKRGAMLVNTSRGQFIDEEALYEAVKTGKLAGAALDVFSQEPYQGRLGELENVILTPHIGTLTQESRSQMEMEATKNLVDFFAGEKKAAKTSSK